MAIGAAGVVLPKVIDHKAIPDHLQLMVTSGVDPSLQLASVELEEVILHRPMVMALLMPQEVQTSCILAELVNSLQALGIRRHLDQKEE